LNEHFFVFLVVLFLALLLKIRDHWIRAEEEKLHAELAYLKTQINPHFLFNTLNSIYAMALGKSEQTAAAIVRLSSMMRYVLTDAGREKVPLKQEIAYLIDYIELQKTRFEGTLRVDLSINGDPADKQLVPLLLIPFVENAFKYGVNPEESSTITIRIDIRDHELALFVANKKVAPPEPSTDPGGLGIKNTRQRLQMLYPGQHTLEIKDDNKDFTVSLILKGI
jgi:LytS/YehU family sensor histidine kinase